MGFFSASAFRIWVVRRNAGGIRRTLKLHSATLANINDYLTASHCVKGGVAPLRFGGGGEKVMRGWNL